MTTLRCHIKAEDLHSSLQPANLPSPFSLPSPPRPPPVSICHFMDENSDSSSPAAMASSSHRYPGWVMLDPYVRLNYPRPTLDYPEEHFRATHAYAETSKGDPVRVSFRAVPPPGASRLYVQTTSSRTRTHADIPYSSTGRATARRLDRSYEVEPRVVAALGNAILLQVTLHDTDAHPTRAEFYVYTAHSAAGQPPSLRRLPRCKVRMSSDGLRLEHLLTLTEIGLLCRRGEFVVADLLTLPVDDEVVETPLEAQLCMLHSRRPDGWEATRPRIRHENGQGQELIWWETDAVVPCGDSVCYVNFLRGILFVDVLSERPELRYVRLPVRIPSGNPADRETGTRGCPHAFRNVLRFVDVVTSTVFVSGCHSPVSSSFAINLWKLVTATMTWEKERTMEEGELWDLQGYGDLPRVAPEFPVVSMEEPSVVYLVLSNDSDCSRLEDIHIDVDTRIIVVDMLNRTLRSWFKYTNVNPFHDDDGNMASRNLSVNEAFIPCEFSKYL